MCGHASLLEPLRVISGVILCWSYFHAIISGMSFRHVQQWKQQGILPPAITQLIMTNTYSNSDYVTEIRKIEAGWSTTEWNGLAAILCPSAATM